MRMARTRASTTNLAAALNASWRWRIFTACAFTRAKWLTCSYLLITLLTSSEIFSLSSFSNFLDFSLKFVIVSELFQEFFADSNSFCRVVEIKTNLSVVQRLFEVTNEKISLIVYFANEFCRDPFWLFESEIVE